MAEHDGELRRADLAVAQVQVGAANATGSDCQAELARLRFRVRERGRLEWLAGGFEDGRAHRVVTLATAACR
jgi:hypothetical protein